MGIGAGVFAVIDGVGDCGITGSGAGELIGDCVVAGSEAVELPGICEHAVIRKENPSKDVETVSNFFRLMIPRFYLQKAVRLDLDTCCREGFWFPGPTTFSYVLAARLSSALLTPAPLFTPSLPLFFVVLEDPVRLI